MLNRRTFTASSLAAIAFAGLARRSPAQTGEGSYRNEVPGYGDLAADPAGLLDLPPGFSYSVVSSAGEVTDEAISPPRASTAWPASRSTAAASRWCAITSCRRE